LALVCWLAQPGILAGAGTIADGIKSGSLRQRGVPRLPLGGRHIARGSGHRDPGDRIAPAAVALNGPALVGPSVLLFNVLLFPQGVLAAEWAVAAKPVGAVEWVVAEWAAAAKPMGAVEWVLLGWVGAEWVVVAEWAVAEGAVAEWVVAE